MTRMTNARLAGLSFLCYIVAGMTSLALAGRPHATAGLGLLWFPMAVFEIALAVWLLARGIAPAPARASA